MLLVHLLFSRSGITWWWGRRIPPKGVGVLDTQEAMGVHYSKHAVNPSLPDSQARHSPLYSAVLQPSQKGLPYPSSQLRGHEGAHCHRSEEGQLEASVCGVRKTKLWRAPRLTPGITSPASTASPSWETMSGNVGARQT